VAGAKYITALSAGAGALPMLIPPLGGGYDFADLVARLDGLLVTGSPSNIEPRRYGGAASKPGTAHDPKRDATSLPLIRAAIAAACPVLAICRGIQELNVALGGTLHQEVHAVPGRFDHREDKTRPLAVQYGPAHPVRLVAGGVLEGLAGSPEITVNSVHAQGIDALGAGLAVEARAPDGQIEAVRVADAGAFALGVQWHPEWRYAGDPVAVALFAAFGAACRARAEARAAGGIRGRAAE
jgi:putative glutamine amidotransferase